MQITCIRHTSVNAPKGTCYGRTDVLLADSFPSEQEKIRSELGNTKFDAVFSSPSSRCTILATAISPDIPVTADARLTELDFGDWEMTDWDTIFESPEGKAWFADYLSTPCPNGESFASQIARTRSFLNDLKDKPLQEVLIVTHAGVIRAMMTLLQKKTPRETFNIPIDLGQIITFNL